MKKILFIASFMLIAIFASTSVYAADVVTFEGLVEALTESSGGDMTIKSPITVTGTKVLDLMGAAVTAEEPITVEGDLTIKGSGKLVSSIVDDMIIVKPGATLTIENAYLEATAYKAGAIKICGTTGKTTLVNINKDAVIKANYPAYIAQPGGQGITVNIRGQLLGLYNESGTKKNGGVAFYINGLVVDTSANAPVVNVYEGAVLTADKTSAVYAGGYAVWNIYGGTFTGEEALSIKAGTFNITGGTFIANGPYVNPVLPEHDGSESSGSAISVTSTAGYNAGKIELNISNATVESANGHAILEVKTDAPTSYAAMGITGGTFTSAKEAVSAQNVAEFISGGTFSSDVEDYLDTSKTAVKDETTGEYYVGVESKITVKAGLNGKATAAEKAVEGQPVKVTVTPDKNYEVASIKVTDAAGAEVTVKDNTFTMPGSDVTVEVTFKEMAKDGTPATGSMNVVMLVSAAIAVTTFGVLVSKKYAKNN